MEWIDFLNGLFWGTTIGVPLGYAIKRSKTPRGGNNIGRVYLRGQIGSGASRKKMITLENVEKKVESALEAKVKGLIFDIESPGGTVVPSKQIAEYIKGLDVPTVALVQCMAASGGYWIASACDKIVADEFSEVGSIGVLLFHVDASGLAEKLGIKYDGLKSVEYKDVGNPLRAFTEEETERLSDKIFHTHRRFVETIASNRGIPVEKMHESADGMTYDGQDAVDRGLVDYLGGKDKAVELLEDAGGFKHSKILDFKDKRPGLLSRLAGVSSYDIGTDIARGMVDTLRMR